MITKQPMRTVPSYQSGNTTLLGVGDADELGTLFELLADDDNYTFQDGRVLSWDENTGEYTSDPYMQAVIDEFAQVTSPTVARQAATQATANATATGTTWIDAFSKIVPTLLQTNAQRQLINTNLARAQRGLPPISLQSVTPGLNFGLSSSTQNTVLLLGALVVGAMVLSKR